MKRLGCRRSELKAKNMGIQTKDSDEVLITGSTGPRKSRGGGVMSPASSFVSGDVLDEDDFLADDSSLISDPLPPPLSDPMVLALSAAPEVLASSPTPTVPVSTTNTEDLTLTLTTEDPTPTPAIIVLAVTLVRLTLRAYMR